MSKDSSYFQDCWLVDDRFKDWISETQFRTEARCKLCRKTITLSNMGVQALKNHAGGKKHKEHCMKVSVFLRGKKQAYHRIRICTSLNLKVANNGAISD